MQLFKTNNQQRLIISIIITEKLGEETKQKKAKSKADRETKKKEDEEKEKALREKLAKLRASKKA